MESAVIVDAVRTASGRGKMGGALSGVHPTDLLATVLASLLERNGLDSAQIDDVLIGCVSQIGDQSSNIARGAVLAAGFDTSVPAATIDRQCGSSQQAAAFAAQGVMSGAYDIAIAGGVESMSRVPLGAAAAGGSPNGERMRARYPEGLVNQGVSAELIASKWGFSRKTLDEYAAESHRRAAEAADSGHFQREILPVTIPAEDGTTAVFDRDETVRAGTTVEALAGLQPAFRNDHMVERFPDLEWSITPGNSSPLTDGASAVLVMSETVAKSLGLRARARFHSFSVVGDDPLYMLTGPIPATHRILKRSGLSFDDLDAYEVNEAFASVPLAWAAEFGADPAKLNPRGGAIALGHALGSSGTRLLTTMLHHLEATGGRYGLQTMCEGGGMANATIIERL
ncbi:thiolase family protein [Salinibacterium sp. dk2585]|uniref:thiolase family protein n=1 Tax=unclassified Salinibacterium TaxID=2632331 RepID=UPI0011C251CE|nr:MULTISPECIES: thiolase family protein [unclassified Salinibacterium]QEE60762.1 thiolase family protein [Salinibacterium sp. dk2585]TXK55834.1 thiolase family protein [Salinibacterium sp. dk5596]